MSNPFDQFASDFQAALPGASAPAFSDPGNPFANGFGPPPVPPTPPKPVMNAPVMNSQPQYNGGGYGGGSMGGGMMGGSMGGGMGGGMGSSMGGGMGGGMGSSMGGGMGGGMSGGMGSSMGGSVGGGMYGGTEYGAQPQYGMMGGGPMGGAPMGGGPMGGSMNGMGSSMGQPPMGGPPSMGQPPNMYGGMGSMNGMGMMGSGADPNMMALVPSASTGGPPPGHDPFSGYGAPPSAAPQGLPPSNSFDSVGQHPTMGSMQAPNDPFASYGAPPSHPPPGGNPYGAPAGAPPSFGGYGQDQGAPPPQYGIGGGDPFGAPSGPYGAPPPPAPPANDPYSQPPSSDPFGGYGVPSNDYVAGPYGAPPPAGPPANDPYSQPPPADPFGGYGAPPPSSDPYASSTLGAPPPYADPWAQSGYPPADPGLGAIVPSQQQNQPYAHLPPQHYQQQQQMVPVTDPFSVFSAPQPAPAPPPAPQQQQLVPASAPAGNDDMWGDMGFDPPPGAPAPAPAPATASQETAHAATRPERHGDGEKKDELPPGGEWYDARIFTPTLGVMFFKPQELTDSLFLNTDRAIVGGLGERPVVAFIVEGSSARSAGVELGHVLLKVNGVDVKNPKEASRLIKEGPRPLPLLFYVPNTDVVVAEGEHMVKYDTRETTAPNSAKDWKPKYVVIGGIIAQPWMMNMYRSKSEYDIAVIETQARRPVSVKVKQFSLQGARIQNDWQGPQMVKYKNKLHPWKYIVVLPVARNPIKISSPNLAHLKPVHEGIRRVLLSQQRDRGGGGGNQHNAAPARARDPYQRPQHNSDPYAGQRQQQIQQEVHNGDGGQGDPYGRGEQGGY